MSSLKDIRIDGLKELRENGLKALKIRGLKDLMLKPEGSRIENMSESGLEDLTKKRENVKRKIKKLNQEKKKIEIRIDLIRKARKEKDEEISEFPWREEIFPPFPEKKYVKASEVLETKDDTSEAAGFSEVKDGRMKITIKEIKVKPGSNTPEKQIPEDIEHVIEPVTIQTNIINSCSSLKCSTESAVEGADPRKSTGKKDEEKAFPEKEEKIKNGYPFSARKVNEYKSPEENIREDSVEKRGIEASIEKRPEASKPIAGLFGESLIEELINSNDFNPEEEQGFIKYLQEPKIEELIDELKDIRHRLVRAEHAG